jgi:hypothetical protein
MGTVATIQDQIDHGMEITGFCRNNHYRKLDLQKLGEWLGFDHSTMHEDLTPKLWCPTCKEPMLGLLLSKADNAASPYRGSQ